jgi:DNA-binding CsgD family transcriptional regulator
MHGDEKHDVAHLLEEMDFALDQKRWSTVEDLARQIQAIDPDNPDALALTRTAARRKKSSPQTRTSLGEVDAVVSEHQDTTAVDSFVGRSGILAHLKQTLERTASVNGQMDMIVGEPGIGKSRLIDELSSCARQKGMRVLFGRCYEEEGAPPYWPWVQVVRAYLSETPSEEISTMLGSRASLVTAMFPELGEHLPGLEPFEAGSQDPEAVRFRLFDAVVSFLVDISSTSPTLIVLDDLHWSDDSSLKLLVFLARELERSHLYVLGTYRDVDLDRKHPLSDALGELARERLFGRHPLKGFTLPDVHSYIQVVSGSNPPERLVQAVFELTSGNPLFVSQMTRLLAQDEKYRSYFREGTAANEMRLPEGVREVIGKRLNHLSQECNEILVTAAVLGPEFQLRGLILTMGEKSEESVLNALDEAEGSHFVAPVANRAGVYQFTHALVRQTLTNELSLSGGVKLHARITKALEELYQENLDAHAEELAAHAEQAETVLGPDRLVRYSLLAGEQASERHAHEEALRHFSRGLSALEHGPLDDRKASLLYGRGMALASLLLFEQARQSLGQAMDYYEETGDVARVTAIALAPLAWASDISLCERALKMIPAETPEMSELLSQYGALLIMNGRDQNFAIEQLEEALRIAENRGDDSLKARIHTEWAFISWYQLRTGDCLDHSIRAIGLSSGLPDRAEEFAARRSLVDVLQVQGETKEALRQVNIMHRIAQESGDRWQMAVFHRQRGKLAIPDGDWTMARRNYDTIISKFTFYIAFYARALIEYETGNPERGQYFIERFTDFIRSDREKLSMSYSFWALLIARVSRISGETTLLDLAEAWGHRALELNARIPLGAATARVALGLLAVLRGDGPASKEQFDILIGQVDSVPGSLSLYSQHEPYGEFFGLYTRSVGKLDESVDHLRKTLAANNYNRPRCGWLSYELAVSLQERAQRDDVSTAEALLEGALEMSVQLGMLPLEARVRERLSQLSPPNRNGFPDSLTQREVEVIHQLVVGKTDQEIADTLFISIKTASNHVGNILRKTGCGNRTEAANYAVKQGLVDR